MKIYHGDAEGMRERNPRKGKRECCGILIAASTRRIQCRNTYPEENGEEEGFNSCETQIGSPAVPLFLPERRYAILAIGVLAICQNRITFSFSSSPPPLRVSVVKSSRATYYI